MKALARAAKRPGFHFATYADKIHVHPTSVYKAIKRLNTK
jgi:hypothetical protein